MRAASSLGRVLGDFDQDGDDDGPGGGWIEVELKMPFYAQAGIGHLWLVDPLLFTLEAHRLDAGAWRQLGVWRGEAVAQAEPFDALPLKLSRLWGRRKLPQQVTPG